MSGTDILVTRSGGAAWIVFNRPERRNAVTYDTLELLGRRLQELADDPSVRAVVLSGAGSAFCAGGDVATLAQGSDNGAGPERRARLTEAHETVKRLHAFPKPSVAAINGPAVGAGLVFALACDLRVMESTATLRLGYSRVALPGDFGGSWLLSRIVGPAAARRLYLLDEVLSAHQARQLGIVDLVASGEQFTSEVAGLASRLAAGPTLAYALAKANLAAAETEDLETTMRQEIERHLLASESADHKHALEAFAAGRTPVFDGR